MTRPERPIAVILSIVDWAVLAETIIQYRKRRGWWQHDLARRSGISASTLGRLESGRTHVSDKTLLAVEAALGWEPGSIERVLQGGQPKQIVDEDLAVVFELWSRIPPRHRAMLRQMAEQVAE